MCMHAYICDCICIFMCCMWIYVDKDVAEERGRLIELVRKDRGKGLYMYVHVYV